MQRRLPGALAVCVLCLALGGSARASHTTFSYTSSAFELSGSQGSFFDPFDDGVLAPWLNGAGTGADTGSGLLLRDPGTDITVTSPFWSDTETRDVSSVLHTGLSLADGGGDFLLQSIWISGAPAVDQLYGMNLQTDTKAYALILANWSAELAAKATNPLDGGIYAWFTEATMISPPPDIELDNDPDPSSSGHLLEVTDPFVGDVILRIAFTDGTDLLDASFSVDGGTSFNMLLSSYALEPGWTSPNVSLLADPVQVVPEPGGAGLVGMGLLLLAARRRR